MKNFIFISLLIFISTAVFSQNCTNLGQNPSTAFPVCGSSVFNQSSVDICGTRQVPTPCPPTNGAIFQDKNPYWYKITCLATGTLAFEIVPTNIRDDYDWQLFDITQTDPNEVYTNKSLFVACNWSGDKGKTGTNPSGTTLAICNGQGQPLYSKMPTLLLGHEYLLLVSHYTDTQSGYSLSFDGGTAIITDTTASSILTSKPSCDGKTIGIKLSKNIRCNSLTSNGSDFILSSSSSKIVGATGINCTNSFDLDSLVLTLDQPLAPGNYTVKSQKGDDGNTLLDYCQNPMAENITTSFVVTSIQPPLSYSITKPGCKPNQVNVVFSNPVLCNSVAPDGSDFSINTPGISITGATTLCTNKITYEIVLSLSATIYTNGTHTITFKKGVDGNGILDQCLQETIEGSKVSFVTADTVSAAINYNIINGCNADTLHASNAGLNNISEWRWKFNARDSSRQQNPTYVYNQFGPQNISLQVNNGVCTDSSSVNFILNNEFKANFVAPAMLCPQNPAMIRDSSIGNIVSYLWDFGNGATSTLKNPMPQMYPSSVSTTTYTVRLTVRNANNCADTISKNLQVLNNCFISVASAFTPNSDGLNDYLYPISAQSATNLQFAVYNRFGQLLFKSTDLNHKWDGTFKSLPQPTGTYVWMLQYINAGTGQTVSKKGTSVLLR